MMKTRISTEPTLLLSVVIPIAQTWTSACKPCEGTWLENDTRKDNHNTYSTYVDTHVREDSECTEEEKVAVEQLAELRRIRNLSMQEDASNSSSSSEGSFNTYEGKLPPLLALSHTCNKGNPSTSPAASSTAACIFGFLEFKHKQKKQEYELQSQQKQGVQDNLGDDVDIQVATSKHVAPLSCHELDWDDDGRKKPRSRSLSDIYRDISSISSFSLNSKANKRSRKAISKIMAVG